MIRFPSYMRNKSEVEKKRIANPRSLKGIIKKKVVGVNYHCLYHCTVHGLKEVLHQRQAKSVRQFHRARDHHQLSSAVLTWTCLLLYVVLSYLNLICCYQWFHPMGSMMSTCFKFKRKCRHLHILF